MRHTPRQINTKRTIVLVAALALFGGLAYGANKYQVRRNAAQMLAQAREARQDQNRGDALLLYETYLNFQPRDVDALAEYAGVLEGDQNPKAKRALIDCYERMMLTAPNRAEERKKLVKLYMNYQVYSSAKHHLEQLLDPTTGTPDDSGLLEQLAACEFRLGRTADGSAILKRLITAKKASPDVYRRLADVIRKENEQNAAEEADRILDQMAKDLPNDITARVIRVRHLFDKGEAEAARKELLAASREASDPHQHVEFSLLLAEHFTQEKQHASAREVLSRAIGANPDDARLRTAYYKTLDRLKDAAKAQEELKKAIEVANNNDPHTIELLDAIIDNGELDLARREVEKRYKGKEPFRPVYDYLTGRLFLAEGNWPAALTALTACLEFFERFPAHYAKAQFYVAQCQMLANNPERTLEAYAKAAVANPRLVPAQLGKADTLLRLNRLSDAEPILREHADAIPAARLALVNAKFLEQANKPADTRRWAEFEASLGKPPYPVGVEMLRAQAVAAKGQPADAEKMLRDLAGRAADAPTVRVALAELVARRDPKEALDVLAAAEKEVGDAVSFRLARANLLARTSRDAKAVRGLADGDEKFSPADRHELALGVANLLIQLGQPAEAVDLAKRVATARPFDLTSRTTLTQIYLQTKRLAEADGVIAGLKKLDGDGGPIFLFAQVMSELAKTDKPTPAQAVRLRAQLQDIVKKRESWSRPHALLGDLAHFTNDTDGAILNYRRAYELGDRDETLVRKLVEVLLSRSRRDEARKLLDDRERVVGLPTDLRQTLSLLEASAGLGGDRSRDIVRRTEDSTDPKEQLFRGNWFLLNGNKADAVTAFAKATQHGPYLPEAWVALVQAQVLAGDLAAARQTLEKVGPALAAAGDKLPNKAAVPQAVGFCHELVGDIAGAEKAYLTGLRSHPNDGLLLIALAELYRKVGRHPDADAKCEAVLASNASDDLKRTARRNLAAGKVVGPNGHAQIESALALLDENLKAGEHPADVRAKAFVLARDPFRRVEAHLLLEKSAARDPLTPEEAVQRALLFVQEGRNQAAETDLKEATKSPTARPAHLILLHQVQVKLGRLDAARTTLERIKAVLPKSWDATAEEARLVAKQGDKPRAAALVDAFAKTADDGFRLQVVGPLLTEIGCLTEAEAVFRNAVETSRSPLRFTPLVLFLVESRQQLKAIETAWKLDEKAAPQKIQLLKVAVATRHRAAVPAAELAAWDRAVGEAAAWIVGRAKTNPKDAVVAAAEAAILDAQGKYDDAIRAYERLLALDGKQVLAMNNLASLLVLHNKDGARALELMNKAVALAGPQSTLLDTRAMAATASGKPREALADLTAARFVDPKPVYDFHAALAAEKLDDGEQKRNWLESARDRGLKKAMLHPLEWPAYERLYGPE
jgi:predicted Zn-dependent protease